MASENLKVVLGIIGILLGLGFIFMTFGLASPGLLPVVVGVAVGLLFAIGGGWTARANW